MELLAPAGNLEAGIAAFHYGADAVYLGMHDFSARADADNFGLDDLAILMGIAHHNQEWRRKVYVTINTLVQEQELPALIALLAQLRDLEVDALIIQDLALLAIVKEHFPEFELHASTQMAIHNPAGARQAAEMGLKRVIAARELTITEIEQLTAATDAEIEVFVHGALCYSYSGLCLLSAALRGRSGNRGECAYLCRKSFLCQDHTGKTIGQAAPFSMKDLALRDQIPALRAAKVAALKIEGRKKTPLYVAAATNFYRNLMDRTFEDGEEVVSENDLKTIFSRPWTQFHLRSRRAAGVTDPYVAGHRGVDVGTVAAVRPGQPAWLRFVLKNHPLEKHDGLQVEIPGRERPYGFPVDDIRVFSQANASTWTQAFVAEPGATIEVPLPEDCPDLPLNAKICQTSSQAVKQRYEWPTPRPSLCRARYPVYFDLTIEPQCLTVLSQPCAGPRELSDVKTVMALEAPLAPANKPENVLEAAKTCFAKLGDTALTLADLRVSNPDQLFVPTSLLNEVRRRAAEDAQKALDDDLRGLTAAVMAKVSAWQPDTEAIDQTPSWSIKLDRAFYLNAFEPEDLEPLNEVVLALDRAEPNDVLAELAELERILGGRNRIRIALPVICRTSDDHDWTQLVATLFRNGWRRWMLTNLASAEILAEAGANPKNLNLTADWTLYACNRLAAKQLLELGVKRVTLSPEDRFDNWRQIIPVLGPVAEVPVYQDTPLAISAVCAMASLNGICSGKRACNFTSMTLNSRPWEVQPSDSSDDDADDDRNDRQDARFASGGSDSTGLIAINNNCQTVVINSQPLDLAGHLGELRQLGARHFRADFIWRDYAPIAVRDTWRRLRQDAPAPNAWTANFFRK